MFIESYQDLHNPSVYRVSVVTYKGTYEIPILTKKKFAYLEKCISNSWVGRAWQVIKKYKGIKVNDTNQLTKKLESSRIASSK